MPHRIGNHIVSFHRPALVKTLLPTAKDKLSRPGGLLADAAMRPAPTHKPLVQFSRVTPYNRLPSIAAVNMAIDAIPLTTSLGQVVTQVQAHIAAHRMRHGEPAFVIVGERHGQPVSAATAATVLHAFQATASRSRVLFEMEPNEIRENFPTLDDDESAEFTHLLAEGTPARYATENPVAVNLISVALYGQHLGFDLSGFDPLRLSARHQEQRESAMLASIANGSIGAQTTIVFAGAHHVPVLHEQLSQQGSTLAIGILEPANAGDTDAARRKSYLLSTPEFLTINPAAGLLGTPPLELVSFVNRHLERRIAGA
jgi:hypothetical protein